MLSFDPIDKSSLKSVNRKGRLARSLDFKTNETETKKTNRQASNKKSSVSIWRDPLKSVLPQSSGFTTHKMSSVTNNFMSSDLISSDSEIDEMVGDLIEPGRGTLVFPQHDDVFRTSPLSSSSFSITEDNEGDDNIVIDQLNYNNENLYESEINYYPTNTNNENVGMSWNPKRNQWIPLIYRYVFPSSTFTVNTSISNNSISSAKSSSSSSSSSSWSLINGQFIESNTSSASFSFPPPKKSIMMGPNGINSIITNTTQSSMCSTKNSDSDARDVCEKLLELIDDENLMLPVVKMSSNPSPRSKSSACPPLPVAQTPHKQIIPGKSLLSEWSSLPSSPPPPIFHDVCNRPIPELRLSPPMTGKSISKRLFPTATTTTIATPNASVNSPCESPLTKRLRFSSSSSSITSQ